MGNSTSNDWATITNANNPVISNAIIKVGWLIKKGATIGANATVICGITIGRFAFIGAGAVVRGDVPDYALMLGVPARPRGWMSRHGHLLEFGEDGIATCPESQLRYELADGQVRGIDLSEDEPLPEALAMGRKSHRDVKADQS